MRYLGVLLVFACVFKISYGQTDSISENKHGIFAKVADLTEWGLDLITFEKENYTFFVIPMLGYEERTGVSVGLMPSWRFYPRGKEEGKDFFRPSNISPSIEASTTGMYELVIRSEFYTRNKWFFQNRWTLQYMPDKFYYAGNNSDKEVFSDIEANRLEFTGRLMKIAGKKWFVGMNYDVGFNNFKNVDGNIFNQSVAGYDKSTVVGIGPSFTFDNRNNVVYPKSGSFIEGYFLSYLKGVGDYSFSSVALDARTFISLGPKERVLGFQGYLNSVTGDVPFYRLASLGGKRSFRGIARPYKYMDSNSVYLQVAYRSRLVWRFGYEVFTGIGNVFDKWGPAALENVHLMGGIGLRIRVLENEKLNFRIDYGIANRGDNGVFFTLGEAF